MSERDDGLPDTRQDEAERVYWEDVREPENSAECPYCHQTFYALPLHDPLRKHCDYCEDAPENEK